MIFRTTLLTAVVFLFSSCIGEETIRNQQRQVETASSDSELHLAVNRYKRRFGSKAPWTTAMQVNWIKIHALNFQKQISLLRQGESEQSDSLDLISDLLVHNIAAMQIPPEALGVTQMGIDSLLRNYKARIATARLKGLFESQCPSGENLELLLRTIEQGGGISPNADITAQDLKALLKRCFESTENTEPDPRDSVLFFIPISY